MEAVCVERLDHLGLIASVIHDLGLVSMIDARVSSLTTKRRSPQVKRPKG